MKRKKEINKKVKNYYQNCHKNWGRQLALKWKIRGLPSFLYQRKRLLDTRKEIMELKLKEKVLDVACGDGYLLRFSPLGSVGIEIDPYQANRAQVVAPHTQVINGDIEKIPFPKNYFSTVLATEIFEHLPDSSLAIAEMWRVLKTGGLLFVSVPTEHPLWKIRSLASPMAETEPQCLSFSKNSLLSLFSCYKYRIKKFKKIALGLNYLLVLQKTG